VRTGADITGTPVDTVGANNEGGNLNNSITTTAITPGGNGHLEVCDSEWQAAGIFEASSDLTQESATWSLEFSVCTGYKACTSGVPVTANLNAFGGTAVQHKWVQVVILAAAEAVPYAPSGRLALTQRMG
jgi:hypothetical protein